MSDRHPNLDASRHDADVPPEADHLPTAPSDTDPSAASPPAASSSRYRNLSWAAVAALFAIIGLFVVSGSADALQDNLVQRFAVSDAEEENVTGVRVAHSVDVTPNVLTLRDYAHHPDRLHQPYMAGPVLSASTPEVPIPLINQFRDLLSLYEERMGKDDNFTVRVVDNRTAEALEVYVLEAEREEYQRTGEADWHVIDQKRLQVMRQLISKYVDRGIPKSAITVKFGRATQVKESRQRDEPFVEYEVRLAQLFDLSLLATEVGTVETFNQDRLVSPVGARSRYQMMPYILRENDIYHYSLATVGGQRVDVREEWHPLLTMEPAFMIMRGYANAVGHEIPGISAYHTGPGNIYKVYRFFLQDAPEAITKGATVMDAYMWATTAGFPEISSKSSFGQYSRGYVASAYGALKAVDTVPLDTAKTMRAERVQLASGREALLGRLLETLAQQGMQAPDSLGSLYAWFIELNPHMLLPDPAPDGGIPTSGNLRLVSRVGSSDVRFFLPLGSTRLLQQAGMNVLDDNATFRFDQHTFAFPEGGRTEWDQQYDNLVEDISHFGFSPERRRRLLDLTKRFEQLAQENPTYYRRAQLKIIKTHRQIWLTSVWEKMAEVASAARGTTPAPVRPPALDTDLDLPLSDQTASSR